ncbi:hypothetical protein [Paraferrimonas haliotis]|uniref:Uncharacterized protein n=1 Tax=Paraferrimonas haliotis TaxID=2013866 RepID=A0AA37WYI4_9GAMM|nr:hypothetical protein [Paraferrimonas haliotis]GLS83136.1 hypothetical protein GCM10007894_11130 [Paraferrimonas haliotis]
MSFQEKSAWTMLVALSLAAILYAVNVISVATEVGALPSPNVPGLLTLAGVTVVIAIIGHIVMAALSPKEANAASDERERLISQKAGHWASYVLGTGVLVSLGSFLVTGNGSALFYACFASLIASHLVEYILQIVFNRRVFI